MKTIRKSQLKKNYYWEFRPFYDSLPETLSIPEYSEHVLDKDMTNKKIMETFEKVPFTVEQAFAVVADYSTKIESGKYRLVYFRDEDGMPCRLNVWRDEGGKLDLRVIKVFPDGRRSAGDGVLVSNELSEPLASGSDPLSLGSLDTLAAIDLLKSQGFTVTRTY